MNIQRFVKENGEFSAILLAALIARAALFFAHSGLWWDGGVYIGMGKYIFSFGQAGLWEPLRPVLWPFILGTGWKLGIDTIIFGRIITFILSVASIFLFYLTSKKIFSKKTAVIGSAIFSFSTIFFFMGFRIYTEVPTVFLLLAASYFFVNEKHYLAGISFGLAFLAKFPTPLFFIAAGAALLWKKEIKSAVYLGLGFATAALPFLLLNQIYYGNFLMPMIEGSKAITEVLGCNVLRYKPFYHYFRLIFFDNPLNLFSLLGVFWLFRNFNKNKSRMAYPFLCVVLPLAYFSYLHCRDYRYLVFFIPFVIMFSAFGISTLIRKRKYFTPAVFLIMFFSLALSLNYYFEASQPETSAATGYFKFLSGKDTSLEIWSSNPTAAAYSDAKINKIYYPVFGGEIAESFYDYLRGHSSRIGYVMMDNCGGGIICHPGDFDCKNYLNMTYDYLNQNFNAAYNNTYGRCTYLVYANKEI